MIEQWLENKDTVLFLGVWERINNPGFNSLEFEGIKNEAGRNSFFLSAKKWLDETGEKQIEREMGATVTMYGELPGIVMKSLQGIEGLGCWRWRQEILSVISRCAEGIFPLIPHEALDRRSVASAAIEGARITPSCRHMVNLF